MKRWLLVFIAVCTFNAVAETHSGWQTGKVLSFDSREWTAPSSSGDGTQTRLTCRLVLSVGEVTYVLQRDSPREKPPKLEVGAEVKFVFDHDDLMVRDAGGREFRMRVMKQGAGATVNTEAAKTLQDSPAPVQVSEGKTALHVQSNPTGAAIYLNNEFVGHTPAFIPVEKGSYLIRVQQLAYMAWQQSFVAVGEKMSFYAELSPQDVVFSEPRGGSVAAAAKASKKQSQ
jgi:PEGA domain